MNDACLMKVGWALKRGEAGLWVDVLRGKYGRGLEQGSVVAKATDSKPLEANYSSLGQII